MAVADPVVASVPKHVAIVMDGNGRWAKERGLPRMAGHKQGAEALRKIVRACNDFGIRYLTVYVFSTENWSRPDFEVKFLFAFIEHLIGQELAELHQNGVRMRFLGRIHQLSEKVRAQIQKAEAKTLHNQKLDLNFMLNYGGRAELVDAFKTMATQVKAGQLDPSAIDENLIEQNLYTAGIPDPDILIRTGGNFRVSNYLLWQIAYSEIWVTPQFWPDFDRDSLKQILDEFATRDRRFGGTEDVYGSVERTA